MRYSSVKWIEETKGGQPDYGRQLENPEPLVVIGTGLWFLAEECEKNIRITHSPFPSQGTPREVAQWLRDLADKCVAARPGDGLSKFVETDEQKKTREEWLAERLKS